MCTDSIESVKTTQFHVLPVIAMWIWFSFEVFLLKDLLLKYLKALSSGVELFFLILWQNECKQIKTLTSQDPFCLFFVGSLHSFQDESIESFKIEVK